MSGRPKSGRPTTLSAFVRLLTDDFGWEGPLTEATDLRDDLDVDSPEMLEIGLALEELGGHEVLATVRTLGDLYEVPERYAFHR
jgi:acyl carrier protein